MGISGFRDVGLGFRVVGLRVWGSRVEGLVLWKLELWELGFGVSGSWELGLRVQVVLGIRVLGIRGGIRV